MPVRESVSPMSISQRTQARASRLAPLLERAENTQETQRLTQVAIEPNRSRSPPLAAATATDPINPKGDHRRRPTIADAKHCINPLFSARLTIRFP